MWQYAKPCQVANRTALALTWSQKLSHNPPTCHQYPAQQSPSSPPPAKLALLCTRCRLATHRPPAQHAQHSKAQLTAATAACDAGSIVHTLLYTSGTKKFQYSKQILNTCWANGHIARVVSFCSRCPGLSRSAHAVDISPCQHLNRPIQPPQWSSSVPMKSVHCSAVHPLTSSSTCEMATRVSSLLPHAS